MKDLPTIAVDFDGVLYKRDHLDVGAHTFHGEPVPGAMHFLACLDGVFQTIIFSARFAGYDGQGAINGAKTWFKTHLRKASVDRVRMGKKGYDVDRLLEHLEYTATKPIMARVYLDDRAICFTGVFPPIPVLLKFKTWDDR